MAELTNGELKIYMHENFKNLRTSISDVKDSVGDVKSELTEMRTTVEDLVIEVAENRGSVKMLRWVVGILVSAGALAGLIKLFITIPK